MDFRPSGVPLLALMLLALAPAAAQVIEFESGGLKYQTLTRNGVTVMFAALPAHLREYSILQVAVTNGSKSPFTIRPEDFVFDRTDGGELRPVPARAVVNQMIEHGSRNDVIKLITTYEQALYGLPAQQQSATRGYESRRQSALADLSNTRIKAAAAAAAIALVPAKLAAGESTDGAVFYPTSGKPLGTGLLTVFTAGQRFEFKVE